jgi:phosphatidate cytidylyltransferase
VEANLKSRLGTALVGIPLLVLLVGWGYPGLFAAIVLLVIVASLWEFFVMAFPGHLAEQLVGILFGSGLAIGLVAPEIRDPALATSGVLMLCFSLYLLMKGKLVEKLTRLAWTLLGGFYLGYLLPHLVLLYRLPRGRAWVFFVLLVIMLGDTIAYFVGRRYGVKKLAPAISPGKTVAGAWGYVVGSAIGGGIGGRLLLPEWPLLELVGLSIVLGVLGQAGDLFESWLKRVFAVKDSGTWLPGHGGLLDRLDSWIFPAVFTTAYLKVFHS